MLIFKLIHASKRGFGVHTESGLCLYMPYMSVNWVNIMAADALALGIARSSAAKILTIWNASVLFLLENESWQANSSLEERYKVQIHNFYFLIEV